MHYVDNGNATNRYCRLCCGRVVLILYLPTISCLLIGAACVAEKGTPHKVEGGALQITLHKLSFDHYPYHPNGK